ncbi:MAG: hypothetical protein IKZ44_00365 [Clostridia bacterium]|nr:hypothetical protein [Clostridia bacterium]
MKRIIACVLLLILTACMSSPAESNAPQPAVKAFDTVYCWSGHAFYRTPDESEYAGRIESVVPESEKPAENNEANVPCKDAPFVLLDDGVALLLNGEWQFFRPAC